MKISTNTLTFITEKYGSAKNLLPESVDVLSKTIGAQLGAIETIEAVGDKYEGVIIVKVITCVQHPNADRLHVCTIDDGGITPDVKRDEQGYIQVVCGAPNVREGLFVAWLPPGCTVPDSYATDPFVLGTRELRGVLSNGMIASPKELAISDVHDGILELDERNSPGTSFAAAFDLNNDYVLDIENKMFTHRPDCFGWLGVAREIAGIQGKPFKSPDWYTDGISSVYDTKSSQELPLVVRNDLPELVPRFVAVTMSDITIKPSPLWLQLRLSRHGVRPINNVVDITNFLMLETGQPMHAYDYDKVRALDTESSLATIAVRGPLKDETLELLNGKSIVPHEKAILIASASKAIGLGGVMGGADTEVSEETKNIILECASFDMYSIRRTAMAHGIFTDAVTRYTKGQSPLQNKQVAEKTIEMLEKYADAKFVKFYDYNQTDGTNIGVAITAAFINERLGLKLTPPQITAILENVEFTVAQNEEELIVTAPFWRTDIEIAEDIVEEVGRLYGFDKLPLILPKRSITPTVKDESLETKARIRHILSQSGANEALTYSFVHGNLLTKAGQSIHDAFSLSNAISPDLQYYRLSITPSLLDKVHQNIKAGHGEFALFEIGKAHAVSQKQSDGLPVEWTNIAFVYTADEKLAKKKEGAAYYEARNYAEHLLNKLNINYTIEAFKPENNGAWHTLVMGPFGTSRLAVVKINERVVGFIGEYSVTARNAMKVPVYSAGFELDFDAIKNAQTTKSRYQPLPRFPRVEQDITLKVPEGVSYNEVNTVISDALQKYAPQQSTHRLNLLDIYQSKASAERNFTFRLSIASHVTTLTDQAVNAILDEIAGEAHRKIGAQRI